MTIHPAVRLAVPAALFVILVAAPRDRVIAAADGMSPLLETGQDAVPAVPLEELFHELAAPGAQVTVVEFSDFGCKYCGQFHRETFSALREEYVETGKVRWRFVPFSLGMFPNGNEALRAAICVAEESEEAFWMMRDALFEAQNDWKGARNADPLFRRYAEASGADGDAYMSCYRDARSADRVAAARVLATQGGVRSTPTFFVNGQMIQGALPLREFRAVLEELLP